MLPNLTPDSNAAEAIGSEIINSGNFTVTISSKTHSFPKLSNAVLAWEFNREDTKDYSFSFGDEDDEDDGDELIGEAESIDYVVLQHLVTLEVIQEINDISALAAEDDDFELNVSVLYHTPGAKKPIFRHTFTGIPTPRAILKGAKGSSDPLTFNLVVDCFRWSVTTLV